MARSRRACDFLISLIVLVAGKLRIASANKLAGVLRLRAVNPLLGDRS
ncbi:MAG: hypothetical protein QOI94_457, partial [Acidobacteriaceae bacterium]|nr:hypothetical protein [Acidobacteriaceae bacterium]